MLALQTEMFAQVRAQTSSLLRIILSMVFRPSAKLCGADEAGPS